MESLSFRGGKSKSSTKSGSKSKGKSVSTARSVSDDDEEEYVSEEDGGESRECVNDREGTSSHAGTGHSRSVRKGVEGDSRSKLKSQSATKGSSSSRSLKSKGSTRALSMESYGDKSEDEASEVDVEDGVVKSLSSSRSKSNKTLGRGVLSHAVASRPVVPTGRRRKSSLSRDFDSIGRSSEVSKGVKGRRSSVVAPRKQGKGWWLRLFDSFSFGGSNTSKSKGGDRVEVKSAKSRSRYSDDAREYASEEDNEDAEEEEVETTSHESSSFMTSSGEEEAERGGGEEL